MTLSVRRSVAALALGVALATAGCGVTSADRAATVDGTVISESDLQTTMREVNAMEPALLQNPLSPSGTLTALVQAPVVLDVLAAKGVAVSDSVARRTASERGLTDPSDGALEIVRLATCHRHRPAGRPDHRGRRRDPAGAPRRPRRHGQPALRHLRPADRVGPAHPARLDHLHRRPAVTPGRLGLVLTSPRVAPGLLSHGAWSAVADATVRLARSLEEPLAEAVDESGFSVEEVGDASPPELARRLVDLAATVGVVWLGSSDGDPGLADAIASEVSRFESPPDVEVVVGSWDVQGGRLLDVVATMDRLRSPGGCPWDAEQTHASLAPYLVEEAHEVLHAIEAGDPHHLAEELGDVLLQVVFHARVAEDAGEQAFDIDTVAGLLVDKLVRRHPHVFSDGDASTPAEVEQAWERIKASERAAGGAGGRRRPLPRDPADPSRCPRGRQGPRPAAPPVARPGRGVARRPRGSAVRARRGRGTGPRRRRRSGPHRHVLVDLSPARVRACFGRASALNICNVNLTAREREIVALLRAEPLLDAAALAERIGSTRAAVSVHLSNLGRKGVLLGRGYIVRPEADSVVVVGGAVLDAKMRIAVTPVIGSSNPGTSTSTVGGVGRNIAENLARLGSPTVLVAAVGDDLAGRTVVARTEAAGVECRHVVTSVHPTGTYAAVLDDGGDLLVAVADMRATDELTVADLEVVPTLLANADALVVDANVSATVIRWLLSAAAEAGIPGIFEPVSVAKATEAAPVLDGTVRVHTVTPNVAELAALVGAPVEDDVEGVVAAAGVLHDRGVEHVWVSRGTSGSLLSIAALLRRRRPREGPPRRPRHGSRRDRRGRHRRR